MYEIVDDVVNLLKDYHCYKILEYEALSYCAVHQSTTHPVLREVGCGRVDGSNVGLRDPQELCFTQSGVALFQVLPPGN